MARPIEAVKDINDSKDLWKIAVRCKHVWSVISAAKKEHIEMVLVDSKGDMIQVIVPPFLVSKFKEQLAAGSSYIMQNFKVSNNDFSFKCTNHNCKLVFCGSTSVKKMDLPDIPVNYLNILGLDAIVEGKFQSNVLVDIIGGVTEFSQSQINPDNMNKSKVVFTITDMSKCFVQCTLWGNLAVQLIEYYKTHKEDGNIVVLLINARIKEAQGGYPLNVSNAWNGTKLFINDVSINQIQKLKESLKAELPLLSSSSMQVDATQSSQYSDFDKFLWKAEILSLAEISTLQNETTCVTVATLDKFEAGQAGWYYDGCVECTRSVTLKEGKLTCYAKHISAEPVPRFKLEVLAVDGKFNAKFIFWDSDCVKLIGKTALQMKMDLIDDGEDNPLEWPYHLDAILKKELAIRAVYQPTNSRLSVVGFKTDKDTRQKIRECFKSEEPTSKLETPDALSQDEPIRSSEPLSVSADYDPAVGNAGLTPSKRPLTDATEDNESVQLSSTKITKEIKKEK
ncbi:uncharacterized protein LOC131624788 [Vicia villosa]|uniref:uncharacterized protein LOC131624788 n=1 Tax=Vicia villosa TaxID=3911 RepID=UPI00273BA900|nr:uncharacterized protein LOC131624788 [Vicia villosa]